MADYQVREETIDVRVGETFDIIAGGGAVVPWNKDAFSYSRQCFELLKEEAMPMDNLVIGICSKVKYTFKALEKGTNNIDYFKIYDENPEKTIIHDHARYRVNVSDASENTSSSLNLIDEIKKQKGRHA